MVTLTAFATVLVTILLSIALGFFETNYFVGLGLLLVLVSSGLGMAITFRNARNAKAASLVPLEDYLPAVERSVSHTFKFNNVAGIDQRNPIPQLIKRIEQLEKHSIADEKDFRQLHMLNSMRIDICLANLRYHEEVTLARILGQGTGAIMLSIVLTLWGSVYLAIPNEVHSAARLIARFVHELTDFW